MTNLSFLLYERFFKSFSNKTRFNIIILLMKGPKSVNEISKTLSYEQSRVSHNLKKLECNKFVSLENKGKQRIYSLHKNIKLIINNIDKYIKKYNERLKEC